MPIKIILSAASMGDVDQADFDCWAEFVAEKIDGALGFEVADVDQCRMGTGYEDQITGATEEQEEAILRWLGNEGWEAFGEEWETRRKARDAA